MTDLKTKSDIATALASNGVTLTKSQIKKTSLADLHAQYDVLVDVQMPTQPKPNAAPKTRKLFKRAPGKAADLKPVRKGTKRETLLSLLHAGASYDQIAKTCVKKDGTPWTKPATKAACTTWACSLGYGVTETEPGHFQLVLPKGITSPVIS